MDELTRLATRQPALEFPEFVDQLAASATAKFQAIAEPLVQEACTIAMAEWLSPGPYSGIPAIVTISNCEDEKGERVSLHETFEAKAAVRRELGKALLLLLRRDPTPIKVMNVCLRIMKEAADHPKHGQLIGRNWLGVEMRVDSPEALAHYFPENESSKQFMPNLVGPHNSFSDIKIWTGPRGKEIP